MSFSPIVPLKNPFSFFNSLKSSHFLTRLLVFLPLPYNHRLHSIMSHTVSTSGLVDIQQQNIRNLAQQIPKQQPISPETTYNSTLFAETYNSRTGGCNIEIATHLISLCTPHLPALSASKGLRILDNAAGPLVLALELLKTPAITERKPIHLSAVDLSPDFIKSNAAAISASPDFWCPSNGDVTTDTEVMDGMELKYSNETFDLSFTSLAIFTFPDPVKGASELYRTLKPGGVAGLTTWKKLWWMELIREVEVRIKPAGSEPTRFPIIEAWMVPGTLEKCLRDGGFKSVKEGDVTALAWFESIEALSKSLTDTLKMMVGKGWTDGEKGKMQDAFLEVLKEKKAKGNVPGFKFEEDGRAGTEGVAFTAVARR